MVEEGTDEDMQLQPNDENPENIQDGEQNEPDNPIQEDEAEGLIVIAEDNILSEEESMVENESVFFSRTRRKFTCINSRRRRHSCWYR